jgi:xanthine dehydrogenase iron-sulfur cluster and FAD-binding subunit A
MAVDAVRAKSLFLAASDLAETAERSAFLDAACAGQPERQAAVEALLAAHERSGGVTWPMNRWRRGRRRRGIG